MKIILLTGLILWLSVVGAGIMFMARYEAAPGPGPLSPPSKFPASSRIKQDEGLSTLVFFAHPKCPCTRAAIHELARLMPSVEGRLSVYVIFSKPAGSPSDWADTELQANAETIPGVRVIVDDNDVETAIFGARTSGTGLLYDPGGNLRYEGGITRARGVEGDNIGRSTIADLVNSGFSEVSDGPVYGCPIQNAEASEP